MAYIKVEEFAEDGFIAVTVTQDQPWTWGKQQMTLRYNEWGAIVASVAEVLRGRNNA